MSESKQMFKAGQSHGKAEEKKDQMIESAKDTAQAAADKISDAAQSTKEYAEQKGEQVKNALGMNDNTTSTTTTTTKHRST
ncbi:stress-induced protein KIN2-like [Aristolochia californica]|uniref:stress-induced protein KIN2-like n=1 Tax=Aristolochia californica TaxID=171875 RepID=UPI0035E161B9